MYSLVHLTHGTCPPPQLVYLAAESGYDCVSFRGIPPRGEHFPSSKSGAAPFDFSADRQLFRETKKALADTRILLNDMENARIYTGADIRAYEKDLEIAADLGCTKILTNIWSKEMAEAQEQFDELCELALTYGQSVHLEFVTWSTVRDLQDAAAVLRKSGKDNVGIIIDTLHFYRSRVHPEEIDSIPADWFNYVHLCDCVARIPEDPEELAATGVSERMIPGMGAVNIREIVEKLPPVIYGLEVPSDKMLKEMGAKGYLQELLIRTKKYLQAR